MERNVLGKGLSALIPDGAQTKDRIQTIPLDQIRPSSFQPRKKFSEQSLKELSESIREKGVIQPVLVRQTDSGFELIAGETGDGERDAQALRLAVVACDPFDVVRRIAVRSLADAIKRTLDLIEAEKKGARQRRYSRHVSKPFEATLMGPLRHPLDRAADAQLAHPKSGQHQIWGVPVKASRMAKNPAIAGLWGMADNDAAGSRTRSGRASRTCTGASIPLISSIRPPRSEGPNWPSLVLRRLTGA